MAFSGQSVPTVVALPNVEDGLSNDSCVHFGSINGSFSNGVRALRVGSAVKLRFQLVWSRFAKHRECGRASYRTAARTGLPDSDALLQVVDDIRVHVHALRTVGSIGVGNEQRMDLHRYAYPVHCPLR